MAPAIPPQQPVEDQFYGFLVDAGEQKSLAATGDVNTTSAAQSNFIIRYGIRYLGKPHLCVVPGLVAVDYGQMLNGEAAWEFLLKRSNLYPRAEVFGMRNDGKEDMTYVKNLDLAMPIMVLVYATANSAAPLGSVDALITPQTDAIPERLREYLPLFETTEAWLAIL